MSEPKQITAAEISREVATKEYTKLTAANEYKPGSEEYSAQHKNALSDGDDKGKGQTNTIGSKIDIAERNKLTTMNLFGPNKPYTNPD